MPKAKKVAKRVKNPARSARQTPKLRGATAWLRAHWPKRAPKILARPVAEVYAKLDRHGLVWTPGRDGKLGTWTKLGRRPVSLRVIASTVEECEQLLEDLRGLGYTVVPGSPRPMQTGVGVYSKAFAPKNR